MLYNAITKGLVAVIKLRATKLQLKKLEIKKLGKVRKLSFLLLFTS